MRDRLVALVAVALVGLLPAPSPASPPDPQVLIYNTEGNRLRRYDVDTIDTELVEDVLQPSASDDPGGRDSNGSICRFRDGSGRYVHGEDTGQPNPPAGFGVFAPDGTQVGKLTPTYPIYTSGQPEPHGCAIRDDGILFTTDVGQQGFGNNNGQLTMWFPPFDRFPGPPPPDVNAYPNNNDASTSFCKIDEHIGTAASVVVDPQQRVYVASSSSLVVYRYEGDWPTGLLPGQGCDATDSVGGPMVDPGRITRSVFVTNLGISTYSGLAMAPDGNSLYVGSVLEGKIREFDLDGNFVRMIVDHALPTFQLPTPFGNPQSIAFGPNGTLYYADLALVGTLPNVGPGPNGKVWRVRFDASNDPLTPDIVRQNLAFPDGVAVLAGDLEPSRQRTLAGGPRRQAFYGDESVITPANVGDLAVRWAYTTGGAITGSPVVADVDVPGEGMIRVVYVLSWDRNVYAVRMLDGTLLWKVPTDEQPNATFPTVSTVDVAEIDERDVVYVGSGEIFYALDAASGAEIWRFTAGTGCGTLGVGGPFPGFCDRASGDERNEIEGSAFVAGGTVFVTLDVNDKEVGKGGMLGLDARDGRMRWFFDLESGMTCRPGATDVIRQYDPYHSEAELNLPAGFLSRSGCDHPRTRNGCSNIWSSPAIDFERETLYIASSNCDTDFDAGTNKPEPPMPPYDEAIFSLTFDGDPVWVWRPREVDNDDLAFGGAPNLFEIEFGGATRQVVGIGNKDGTYYVLDRDGTHAMTGVIEPYWQTNVVPGGDLGGILATASVDEAARRIYFSTAAGAGGVNDPPSPAQQPTLHALDMDTGAILWQNDAANGFDPPQFASFGPTSASPGVVYFGRVPFASVRVHDTATGAQLADVDLVNFGLASMVNVRDGTVLTGEGIGPGFTAGFPSELTALCVPGTTGCAPCNNGLDDDDDGNTDHPADTGCTGPADVSELPECADAYDNDHDGVTDFGDDPGCRSTSVTSREAPECNDGIDNDGDTDVDLDDGNCPEAWWVSEATPPILQLTLAPQESTNLPGQEHTVVLEVEDQFGEPYPGIAARFDVTAGPNTGAAGACSSNSDCTTDGSGTVSFTYTGAGGAGLDEIVASVLDAAGQPVESNVALKIWNTPPDCSAAEADPNELWPPDHGFRNIAVSGVLDADDDTITITIDSIRQDEPVIFPGSGLTSPDGRGVDTDTAQVRSERTGSLDGRVYHIGFTAEDVRGGSCSSSVTVCVPHDQDQGGDCVDQGPQHDSTIEIVCGLGFELALLLPPLVLLYRHRRKH
jgi:outer membrane protein assembly factor BamB/sugar lactone lactonase YvrE